MKNVINAFLIGIYASIVLLSAQVVWAQGEGFIAPLSPGSSVQQSDLPPGATYQGGQVLHVVLAGENLHLLAAYYYGDPRQWARIYRENRSVIPNPGVLRVGQKLRISVSEGWQPVVSYQEWFRLATRNGEWAPRGRRRVLRTSGRSAPAAAKTLPPSQQEVTAPPTVSVPEVKAVEVPETPQEITPVVEETPAKDSGIQATKDVPDKEPSVAPAF